MGTCSSPSENLRPSPISALSESLGHASVSVNKEPSPSEDEHEWKWTPASRWLSKPLSCNSAGVVGGELCRDTSTEVDPLGSSRPISRLQSKYRVNVYLVKLTSHQ